MQTIIEVVNPQMVQSPFQQKYNKLLQQFQDLTVRVQQFQTWMCKCYTIKRNPRIIDLQFQVVEEYIADKFNVEIQRMSNEFKMNLQKANDEKSRLQTKLVVAKQKHDKLAQQKKTLTIEKDKTNKKVEQMKVEIDDKNKRLEGGRKKISTLQQQISNSLAQYKKLEGKFNESQESVKNLRQKLKNKEVQMQTIETNYTNKIKQLNQQIGANKSRQGELEFSIRELEQSLKKLEFDYKRKTQDLVSTNQKKIRETISSYQRQMEKKKKESDSLYNTAAIRHEKAIKSLNQKSEQSFKKQGDEYEARLLAESERYKELKNAKWSTQNALQIRIRELEADQQRLNHIVEDNNKRISQLEQDSQKKAILYDNMKKQLDSNNLQLISQNQSHLKQKASYESQISRILEEKQKQLKSQDKISKQTMKILELDYQQKMSDLKIRTSEESQIVKNTLKNQIMDMQQKHQKQMVRVQEDFKKVKESYQSIHAVYENKFISTQKTFRDHTTAINKRTQYQKEVVTQLKQREKSQMKTHYQTIIHKYQNEFRAKVQEQKLLIIMEKDDIIDKQKLFYQEQIKSLARSIEIAGNQKVMGVERKVKFVEKKLRDLEVEYQLIIKQKEILSKTSNTQLQSMKQLQQLFKQEIQKMQQRYNEAESKHESQRYQLEGEIARLMNQIQQNRRQHQNKQQLTLASCKNRVSKNESQMKEFGTKMKQHFEGLQASYNQRYNVLAKSYKQLQFISSQKISLPEDIQIIKVLHKGVLQKQQELRKERQTIQDLRKQLIGKQQANKIFNMKKLDSLNKMNIGNYATIYKP